MGIADKDYFLDENLKLTTDEDKAAFVLIRKGQEIPKEMADKYGIGKPKAEAKAAPASTNKAAKPAENKSQENKDNEDQ